MSWPYHTRSAVDVSWNHVTEIASHKSGWFIMNWVAEKRFRFTMKLSLALHKRCMANGCSANIIKCVRMVLAKTVAAAETCISIVICWRFGCGKVANLNLQYFELVSPSVSLRGPRETPRVVSYVRAVKVVKVVKVVFGICGRGSASVNGIHVWLGKCILCGSRSSFSRWWSLIGIYVAAMSIKGRRMWLLFVRFMLVFVDNCGCIKTKHSF